MGCDSPIQVSEYKPILRCDLVFYRSDKNKLLINVRRVANILNKHTIPVIAINLLTTRLCAWFLFFRE